MQSRREGGRGDNILVLVHVSEKSIEKNSWCRCCRDFHQTSYCTHPVNDTVAWLYVVRKKLFHVSSLKVYIQYYRLLLAIRKVEEYDFLLAISSSTGRTEYLENMAHLIWWQQSLVRSHEKKLVVHEKTWDTLSMNSPKVSNNHSTFSTTVYYRKIVSSGLTVLTWAKVYYW